MDDVALLATLANAYVARQAGSRRVGTSDDLTSNADSSHGSLERRRRATASRPRTASPLGRLEDSIRRISRGLRIAAREISPRGGQRAQLFVLNALIDGEEVSLSDLAQRTMTDRTSVGAVVDRLVEGALVTKGTSEEDRRRASIRITAKGRTVLRGAPRPPTALLVEALEDLEAADLKRLERGLRALTRAMDIDGEPAGMMFEDGLADSALRAPSSRTPRLRRD